MTNCLDLFYSSFQATENNSTKWRHISTPALCTVRMSAKQESCVLLKVENWTRRDTRVATSTNRFSLKRQAILSARHPPDSVSKQV